MQLPALPEKVEARPTSTRSVTVNGEALQLDELGPIVIHEDGRIGRLSNWQEMTDHEKKLTLDFVAKRNKKRREALLQRELTKKEGGEKDC